jgi:hypothetical protein
MPARKVKTGTATSRLAVDYRAKFIDEERIELEVDAAADPGVLKIRVYDPKGTVVCERVIRAMPIKVEFRAVLSGRYEMELSNVDANVKRVFTWSDWDNDYQGGQQLPDGVMAFAFLDVS